MFDYKACDMCGMNYIPRPGSIYNVNLPRLKSRASKGFCPLFKKYSI